MNVGGNANGDLEDDEDSIAEEKRDFAPIQLGDGSPNDRAEGEAEHEEGSAQDHDFGADTEHLRGYVRGGAENAGCEGDGEGHETESEGV